jgi:hypothetical protein
MLLGVMASSAAVLSLTADLGHPWRPPPPSLLNPRARAEDSTERTCRVRAEHHHHCGTPPTPPIHVRNAVCAALTPNVAARLCDIVQSVSFQTARSCYRSDAVAAGAREF